MPIKVMVIDDTVLYRKVASDVVKMFPELELVGTAPNGDLAIRKLKVNPVDLVFCDVHMPGMDGVETLVEIKKQHPKTQVVMMSGISSRSADITIKALEKGAIDFIKKPNGNSVEENLRQLRIDVQSVLKLAQVRLGTHSATTPVHSPQRMTIASQPQQVVPTHKKAIPLSFSILAVGVSTGGPEALNKLIPLIPANIPVPIVLVQHMPAGFTKSLANSLNAKSKINVIEAAEGDVLKKGTLYIAPGGRHMTVKNRGGVVQIGLNDGPPENSCKPSVDVLFRSVSAVYGDKGIVSVILTGMGSDGAKGVAILKKRGAYSITQSAETCVVYGMPKAVDDMELSDKSLSLEGIADEIKRIFKC